MKYLFLVPLIVFAGGCGAGPTLPPIYLGHVATTSGPGSAAGVQEAWGIRLAIEELARDGQNLVADRPVFVKHADAHGQLETMQGEAVRLVNLSRVIALYGGDTKAQVERLEPTQVPLITPLGGRPQGLTKLIFTTGITPASQADALARFAVIEKGIKKFAILVDQRLDESRGLAEAFERALQKNIEEKKEEFAKPQLIPFGKDAKFVDLTKDINPAKVQGLLFAGTVQDYVEWRKTLPSSDLLIFFGGEETPFPENGMGPVFRASAFAVDKDLPKTEEFARKFRENFKEDPDVHAALAYDGIRMMIDAMKRAPGPVTESFLEELRKTKDFPGLTGPVSFGTDQQLRRPIFVGLMDGSKFSARLGHYDPSNP